MIWIARYITSADLPDYRNWECVFHAWRGDDLECFVASFRCCCCRK
jgi:hypothetical protein